MTTLETPETRSRLAEGIRKLQAAGDVNSVNRLVSAYKTKYQKQPDYSITGQDVKNLVAPALNSKGAFDTGTKILGAGVESAKEAFGGVAETWKNAPSKFLQSAQEGADIMKPNAKGIYEVPTLVKGMGTAAFRTAGDTVGTLFAPVGALIGTATGTINKLFPTLPKAYDAGVNAIADRVSDIPAVQKFAQNNPNAGEDFGRALSLLMLSLPKSGANEPITAAGMKEATESLINVGAGGNAMNVPTVSQAMQPLQNIKNNISGVKNNIINKVNPDNATIIANRVKEIYNIENNYAKTRKANEYLKDSGNASRQRVASTDILSKAVDENGLVRTKQPGGPIDQYKAMTLDYAENVVREGLIKEGSMVNLSKVRAQLEKSVRTSGLQGKNLVSALKDIDKEIAGYRLSADANGNVPTSLIHDAKIDTTESINYQTPPEIKTGRKAIAHGLKKTVEQNSSLPVESINVELGKYLQDIKLLERLDGARVKGGKMGKYFAQISGNIVGGAAGSATGGPLGAALGTVLGGELAGKIKGSFMSKTLGGTTGNVAPESAILKKAVQDNNAPRLMLPEPKPGSPRSSIESGQTINLPSRMPLDQAKTDASYSNKSGSLNAMYSPKTTTTTNASKIPIVGKVKILNKGNILLITQRPEFKTLDLKTQQLVKDILKSKEWQAKLNAIPEWQKPFETMTSNPQDIINTKKTGVSESYLVRKKANTNLPQNTPKVNKLSTTRKPDPLNKYIPPEDLIKKTVKYEGGWKTIIEQKSTGKEIANIGSSPAYGKELIKNGYPYKAPKSTKTSLPIKSDPLIQEAKKYKSAEEFIVAQPKAYHFTSPETRITKWSTKKSQGRIWFTDNPKAGENVGASGKGKMYEVVMDKNAKWATPQQSDKSYTDQLIADGYDGVFHPDSSKDYGNYYEVFNPKVIKTKSQLTEIWKKANKK